VAQRCQPSGVTQMQGPELGHYPTDPAFDGEPMVASWGMKRPERCGPLMSNQKIR
jgi:hypothetical protein